MAEALALARALDEAGHVCRDEGLAARGARDAQVGHERGEGVVGHLGACRGDAGDDGALAHGGHAHQGRVGHELHLEFDPVLERGLALLGKGRGATDRGDEVDVAATAGTARGDDDALAGLREIGNLVHGRLRLRVELAHDGAQGHLEDEVLAIPAVTTRTLAVRAATGSEVVLVAVVNEGAQLGVGLDDDAAAVAAVTAVGTALGNEGLAPEGHAAGTAVAALYVDVGKVSERVLHGWSPSVGLGRQARRARRLYQIQKGPRERGPKIKLCSLATRPRERAQGASGPW